MSGDSMSTNPLTVGELIEFLRRREPAAPIGTRYVGDAVYPIESRDGGREVWMIPGTPVTLPSQAASDGPG